MYEYCFNISIVIINGIIESEKSPKNGNKSTALTFIVPPLKNISYIFSRCIWNLEEKNKSNKVRR